MFRTKRILPLLTAMSLLAITWPVFGADDGGSGDAPIHIAGFFERNFVLVEIIAVPIFMFLMVMAMASNTTTETIRTDHQDFFKKPLGSSYTHITVPKEPSSPEEIKNVLKAFCVIYPIVRFTCLFTFFNAFYRFLGGMIDIFIR